MNKFRLFTLFVGMVVVLTYIVGVIPVSASTPGSWSVEWYAYTEGDGNMIFDPADESPANTDIISVLGIHTNVFAASDGTNILSHAAARHPPARRQVCHRLLAGGNRLQMKQALMFM